MSKTDPKILLITIDPTTVPEAQISRIRSNVPHARVIFTDRREQMESLIDQVDVLAGWLPVEMLARATNLRWYQQWGAGADWLIRYPDIARQDFMLTNTSGLHAISISEHILALMLAFAHRLPWAIRAQAQQRWEKGEDKQRPPAFELAGKTMLLVGVGAIGRRTAQIAHALGMRVVGVRRDLSKTTDPGIDAVYPPEQLLDQLPEADFVILTIPLTAETRGMFNRQAFEAMKPSAFFVNIGRGGTVDEPALIEALRAGQIAGAGLDVFNQEPLPAESPLWLMENVIITPHYSGVAPHYDERALDIFVDNLSRFVGGQPLRNLVDKKRGY